MPKYYGGVDLYDDLFLNNNREMYIKMLLLDTHEPEITEFFIKTADVSAGKAGTIAIPLNSYINNGDGIITNGLDLKATQGSTVKISNTFTTNLSRTFSTKKGLNYVTVNSVTDIEAGMVFTTFFPYTIISKIKEIDGNNLILETYALGDVTNESCNIVGYYQYINPTNFYVNQMTSFYQAATAKWSLTGGTYYKTNKYNKLIITSKEIQGFVTSGNLRVDGNSPMRRTLDFGCIVDKEFGVSQDLQLGDFDNKKIKVLIGIKSSNIEEYDYSKYFIDNGTNKDINDIVWFKLGVFYPRNINIKHSTDSYSISITAQDKFSSLDGSFGGLLGTSREFKDPFSSQNTNFYDTIEESFAIFTDEPSKKVGVEFADDFEIFRFSPPLTSFAGTYVTQGSTALKVPSVSNLYVGMEVSGPGIYEGTKIAAFSAGSPVSTVYMDYPAYESFYSGDPIIKDGELVLTGATFKSPSFKNFFAIEPLSPITSSTGVFYKGATIAFKGSTYQYPIYTTIANWSPTTWGVIGSNSKKQYYTDPFDFQKIYISGQSTDTGVMPPITASVGSAKIVNNINGWNVSQIQYDFSAGHSFSRGMYVTITGANPSIYNVTPNELLEQGKIVSVGATSILVEKAYIQSPANYISGGDIQSNIAYFTVASPVAHGDLFYTSDSIGRLSSLEPLAGYQIIAVNTSGGSTKIALEKTYSNTNYLFGYVSPFETVTDASVAAIKYSITSRDQRVLTAGSQNFVQYARYNKYDSNFWTYRYWSSQNNRTVYLETYNTAGASTPRYFWTDQYANFSDIDFQQSYYFVADKVGNLILGYPYTETDTFNKFYFDITSQNTSGSFGYAGIIGATLPSLSVGQGVYILDRQNITALDSGKVYYVATYGPSSLKLKDASGTTISPASNVVFTDCICKTAPYMIGPFSSEIKGIGFNSNGNLYVNRSDSSVYKYSIVGTTTLQLIGYAPANSPQADIWRLDSNGNSYYVSLNNQYIVKLDKDLNLVKQITYSDFWKNIIDDISTISVFPDISAITIDAQDNLYFTTWGGYRRSDSSNYYYTNTNLYAIDKETLLPITKSQFYIKNADYSTFEIGDNISTMYFATQNQHNTIGMFNTTTQDSITAIREFAPQKDNTIQKYSTDKVSSILEEVKNQLGVYQYYYDYDGNFVFKEDKRLSFIDPNFNKNNPYSFTPDNYNINIDGVPYISNFIKNEELIIDYNNTTDLSSFKNDFTVYGAKKGLDSSDEGDNIPVLYHIIVDDLSFKDVPSEYYHPWQQYILDKAKDGDAVYTNFSYIDELKTFFEHKRTRDYVADSNMTYVTGEYLLVESTAAGASAYVSYNVYEVVKGGTPSYQEYPIKRDGVTLEYLNGELQSSGLTVRFLTSSIGKKYANYQGIYSKIEHPTSAGQMTSLAKGTLFIKTYNGADYLYRVDLITSTDGATVFEDNKPISIDIITNLNFSTPSSVGKQSTVEIQKSSTAELAGLSACKLLFTNIGVYSSLMGYKGVFRSDNTGNYEKDFSIGLIAGDPSSWTYFFDIVNIVGSFKTHPTLGTKIPVGITGWAPSTFYNVGERVSSDGKVYEVTIAGTSGTAAISGFGDENNLIADNNYQTTSGGAITSINQLTWKLVQISIDINKMKVSSIGSRKASFSDKDINTLFAPKDSLAFFKKEGLYFFVLSDAYGYENYSEKIHKRIESLIRQFSYLYPNINIVFIPESQVNENFVTSKLSAVKDAFSIIKRNYYLNFVNGQSINMTSIPIYNLEPLGLISVKDASANIFGNFLLTDFSLPLSNEGAMSLNAVKTHPYDDKQSIRPSVETNTVGFDAGPTIKLASGNNVLR